MAKVHTLIHTFCVFNRNLGSSREEATLDERAAQILYFYPEATDTHERVRRIEALQAFVDIAQLIPDLGSRDAIHSVRLSDVRYALKEVETGVFLALGLGSAEEEVGSGNDSSFFLSFAGTFLSSANSDNDPPANEHAMRSFLERIWLLCGPLLGRRLVENPEFAQRFFARFIPRLLKTLRFDDCPLSCACTSALATGTMETFDGFLNPDEFVSAQVLVETLALDELSDCFVSRSLVLLKEGAVIYSQLDSGETRSLAILVALALEVESAGGTGYASLARLLDLESERRACHHDSRAMAIRVFLLGRPSLRLALLRGKSGNALAVLLRDGEDTEEEEKLVMNALALLRTAAQQLDRIMISGNLGSRFPLSFRTTAFVAADLASGRVVASPLLLNQGEVSKRKPMPGALASKMIPNHLAIALDAAWLQLKPSHEFGECIMCENKFCVASVKSSKRIHFKIITTSLDQMMHERIVRDLGGLEEELDVLFGSHLE